MTCSTNYNMLLRIVIHTLVRLLISIIVSNTISIVLYAPVPDFDEALSCYHRKHGMTKIINQNNLAVAKKFYQKNHFSLRRSKAAFLIPPIIHQIWLGSPLPERFKPFVQSWQQYHPAPLWKYMLWTDKEVAKLSCAKHPLFKHSKNFGLKSDMARYEILLRYGGFYADIDLECLKPLDILHKQYHFYGCFFPDQTIVANGLIGASPQHPIIRACVRGLDHVTKVNEAKQGEIQRKTGPAYFTGHVFNYLRRSYTPHAIIFPASYFFAYPVLLRNQFWTSEQLFNERFSHAFNESFTLHYWATSWKPETTTNVPTETVSNGSRTSSTPSLSAKKGKRARPK